MDYLSANDKALIEGYNKNISDNYSVDETECEIRAGQTSAQFEGMNNQITLSAHNRVELGKADVRRLRRLDSMVPAVVYGGKNEP